MPSRVVGWIGAHESIRKLELFGGTQTREARDNAPMVPTVEIARVNKAKRLLAHLELGGKVGARMALERPGSLIPGAVRFWVRFDRAKREIELRLVGAGDARFVRLFILFVRSSLKTKNKFGCTQKISVYFQVLRFFADLRFAFS